MTRSSISAVLMGIILCAGSTYAQPAIGAGGIVNNFSYVLPGLPNYGIAEGSIFDIFGTGLATTSANQGVPLQTALAGVSINITVNGVTTQALPIFVTPLEIAAILPSKTPVGTGTITVTVAGQISPPSPIMVVESAFGLLTANEAGTGVVGGFDYTNNYALVSSTKAINPGEYLVLWGSGLGPVTGDETVFQTPANLTNIPITVSIGGVDAQVTFHGRSTFPGVDQINVVVPTGVSGCSVSVVVTANGVPSNYATLPVAATGRTCSDPGLSPLTPTETETLSSLSNVNLGLISLGKITDTTLPQSFDGIVISPGGTTTQDFTGAFFEHYTAAQFAASGFYQQASIGSCVVTTFNGSTVSSGLITSSPLNAGPTINLTGPDGSLALTLTDGFYSEPIPNPPTAPFPAIIPAGGGTFTFTGTGGPDIGAFTATLSATATDPLVWTNSASITSVTRSTGQLVTWSGGIPGSYVYINGTAFTFGSTNSELGASFTCVEPASAGQFTIPAAVLDSLPASGSQDGISLPGSLSIENFTIQPFTAPNLNLGLLVFYTSSSVEVPFI